VAARAGTCLILIHWLMIRTRRVIGVVKGNNTTGRRGKLSCTECRKVKSRVFQSIDNTNYPSVSMRLRMNRANVASNDNSSV
jgi:hypothetical protein